MDVVPIFNGKNNKKLTPKEDNVMQWHTQAGKITTNLEVTVDFTLPELSATKIVAWNFHVHEYAHAGPLKGSTTPMVDLGTYEFKDLNTEKITPE